MQNVLNINVKGLPPEAVESIINFYEFMKKKYQKSDSSLPKTKSKKRLLKAMEKGMYKLPEDYSFNRDELYD